MKAAKVRNLVLSMFLAAGAVTPGHASIVTVDFSGTLTSAVNNLFDDPSISSSDFFKVGQAFSGRLAYDNAAAGFGDGDGYSFDLQKFDVSIGGVDFSTRFLPRQIYRSSNGDVSFSSGGADQGGGASIDLNLGSFYGNYPTAAEMTGKTANFSFDDEFPLGGQASGLATLLVEGGVSAVPEPASWLMMILGFGTIGLALRRRRGALRMTPALAG